MRRIDFRVMYLMMMLGVGGTTAKSAAEIRLVDSAGVDDSDCTGSPCKTIQYAISQAADGDTITLKGSKGGSFSYTESNIEVDRDLVIEGESGLSPVIVQASAFASAQEGRVFTIQAGVEVLLRNIRIQHGSTAGDGVQGSVEGGGILNEGTLILEDVIVADNDTGGHSLEAEEGHTPAIGHGGGIYNAGLLYLFHSEVIDNVSSLEPFLGLNHVSGNGAGIFNQGTVFATASKVCGNTAGLAYSQRGLGAGLYNHMQGVAVLQNTIICENTTGNSPGDEFDVTIQAQGHGGGLYNRGYVVLDGCTLSQNRAHDGAGVFNAFGGSLAVLKSAVHNNHCEDGEVGRHGSLAWEAGGSGGGLYNEGTVAMENSTISQNEAGEAPCLEGLDSRSGASGRIGGSGGGIFNVSSGRVTIHHSTIAQNQSGRTDLEDDLCFDGFDVESGAGGGIYNEGWVTLKNTIVGENSAHLDGAGPDASGELYSLGYNLIGDPSDTVVNGIERGNLTDVAPLLGPLQHNGASTVTHALLTGSPAINQGDPLFTSPSFTDQRGENRVSDEIVDIGAFEYLGSAMVAYNDFSWSEGELRQNITRYTTASGEAASSEGAGGNLVDYRTGLETAITLTVEGGSWNGKNHAALGGLSAPGTDAHEVFDGKVDAQGVLSYGGTDIVLSFSGLDPDLRYELVLFGNRDEAAYGDRITEYTISGVTSFLNESTQGAEVSGIDGETTRISNGDNTENGYVARYTRIKVGEDGSMIVVVSGGRHYLNALSLKTSG